ncbi:MAG: 50S ribosomal protein L1 [Thermoplasmata archaeon]|nr:50S ribosomal protein L1 [Thermoplasmata archaeon]
MDESDLKEKVIEAIGTPKERKFLESVELAINLKDINLTDPKNRINEEVTLPHGRGRAVKIAAICSGEMALKAKKSADLVVQVEELEDLAGDKIAAKRVARDHEFFIAEAPLMPVIGKRLGVFLGPRGKMPRPLPPGSDPTPMIENLRRVVRVRTKDRPTFHVPVGTRDMPPEQLAGNINAVLKRLETKLERGMLNVRSIYIKTTMGPAVRLI